MKKTCALLIFCFSFSAYGKPVNAHGFRFSNTLEAVSMEDALSQNSEMVQSRQPVLFRAAFDYSRDNLAGSTTKNTNSFSFVDHLYSIQLGVGVFLAPRFLMSVSAPVQFMQLSDVYVSGQFNENGWKWGDTTVDAKIRLSGSSSKINLAFRPHLTLPTGNKIYLLTDDSYGWGGRFLLDTTSDRWTWFMHAGYSQADHAELLSIDRRHLLDFGLGIFYRLRKNIGLNAEWLQSVSVPDLEGGQNPTQVHVAARFDAGQTKFFVGGGVQGFGFTDGNKPLSFFVGMKHAMGRSTQSRSVPAEVVKGEEKRNDGDEVQESLVKSPVVTQMDQEFLAMKSELSSTFILFDNNRSAIRKNEHSKLDQISEKIRKHKDRLLHIVLKGHADPRGEKQYNKKLSEKRATSVKNYLIHRGINEHALLIDGYGEDELKTTLPKEFSSNRRVEFTVIQQ